MDEEAQQIFTSVVPHTPARHHHSQYFSDIHMMNKFAQNNSQNVKNTVCNALSHQSPPPIATIFVSPSCGNLFTLLALGRSFGNRRCLAYNITCIYYKFLVTVVV